jgi:hypothetical protein
MMIYYRACSVNLFAGMTFSYNESYLNFLTNYFFGKHLYIFSNSAKEK